MKKQRQKLLSGQYVMYSQVIPEAACVQHEGHKDALIGNDITPS